MSKERIKNTDLEISGIQKAAKVNGVFKWITLIMAAVSIGIVIALIIFLLINAAPAFQSTGFFKFIGGEEWSQQKGVYGILTSITGTLATIAGAILIGVPLGLFSAIFISRFAPKPLKGFLSQMVALFAGIPSVVYGFFGYSVLLPAIAGAFNLNVDGKGLLISVLILAFMITPTVINITVGSLDNVDDSLIKASTAMGNSKSQTVFRISVPAAKRGIFTACILGIGRALGEGIALSMVCGNAIEMPKGLFTPFNTMTTLIFNELPQSDPAGRNALFACGVILFIFTIIVNFAINAINRSRKGRSVFGRRKKLRTKDLSQKADMPDFSVRKNARVIYEILRAVSVLVFLCVFALFFYVIIHVLAGGIPHMTWTNTFGAYSPTAAVVSILPQINVTLIMIAVTLVICIPVGVLAALYLCEYANKKNPLIRLIRFAIQLLSGAPGIIIGLLGYMLFIQTGAFGRGYSLMAGILTMCFIALPTVIKTTENAFHAIPQEYRDASKAMGVSKARMIRKIILPQARAGIFSAIVLVIAKVISESAALIFTSGTSKALHPNLFGSGATLAVSMYYYATNGTGEGMEIAYRLGVFIIFITILANLILAVINRFSGKKKRTAGVRG